MFFTLKQPKLNQYYIDKNRRNALIYTSVASPDIHLLRVFITVAEAGGFSRAQLALNVSQSTISTQMADLEARLGMRLCRRGRAGFALTDDGQSVLIAAKELFQACAGFANKINILKSEVTGELRVATADALLGNEEFPIDTIIAELRRRMPLVKLHFSVMDPLQIERLILEQKLHAGIHTYPNHAPGLRYIKLFSEEQTMYCGKGHSLFDQKQMPPPEELEQFDYAGRTYYGGSLRSGSFQPKNKSASSSTMEGILSLILSGRFLGHLPVQSAKPWLKKGKLQAVMPEQLSYSADFECVFHVGARISRAQRIFEEVVRAQLAG